MSFSALGLPLAAASPLQSSGVFGVLAGLALISALLVIRHRKPLIQALFLVIHLLTIAGLFVALDARFLAVLQVLIYAGAVVVLIVFVLMLLNLPPETRRGAGALTSLGSLLLGIALTVFLARAGLAFEPPSFSSEPFLDDYGTASQMGRALFEIYFYPFEVVSLALVAALIGAVVLAKRDLRD